MSQMKLQISSQATKPQKFSFFLAGHLMVSSDEIQSGTGWEHLD